MRVLVVGGSGSGKSAFAEQLACTLGTRRTYLATMDTSGAEAQERIRRHRAQRAGLGFRTIECRGALPEPNHTTGPNDVTLLDDLGNLVADALFLSDGTMNDAEDVLERLTNEVLAWADAGGSTVVVGNSVGSAGRYAYPSTNEWIRLVGALCCRIAAHFDVVAEVVCGQPLVVKGELP